MFQPSTLTGESLLISLAATFMTMSPVAGILSLLR